MKKLDPHKASGLKGIPPFLLQGCVKTFNKTLAMFKIFPYEGTVPNEWKRDFVVPIYKKVTVVSLNYRPVSLMSIAFKILEKIIREQIEEVLTHTSYPSGRQHGFRRKRSCMMNLLNFYEGKQHLKIKDCVILDYQNAFGTVLHKRLVMKF